MEAQDVGVGLEYPIDAPNRVRGAAHIGTRGTMAKLRWVNLITALVVLLPPMAHVLELPNKVALDGALWLAVQQHLYRGWGPFFGGPAELIALTTTLALLAARRGHRPTCQPTLLAAIAYMGMVVTFFLFNAPVNKAVSTWTVTTLPADWATYRLRWELGHVLAALLAIIGLAAVVRARIIEMRQGEE